MFILHGHVRMWDVTTDSDVLEKTGSEVGVVTLQVL